MDFTAAVSSGQVREESHLPPCMNMKDAVCFRNALNCSLDPSWAFQVTTQVPDAGLFQPMHGACRCPGQWSLVRHHGACFWGPWVCMQAPRRLCAWRPCPPIPGGPWMWVGICECAETVPRTPEPGSCPVTIRTLTCQLSCPTSLSWPCSRFPSIAGVLHECLTWRLEVGGTVVVCFVDPLCQSVWAALTNYHRLGVL